MRQVPAVRAGRRRRPRHGTAAAQGLICLLGLEAGLTSPRIGAFLHRSPAAVRVTAQRTRAKLPHQAGLRESCQRLRRRLPAYLQARRARRRSG